MAGVIQKFVTASMFMWIIPVAILYAFNNNLLPGKAIVSSTASYLRSLIESFKQKLALVLCWVFFLSAILLSNYLPKYSFL